MSVHRPNITSFHLLYNTLKPQIYKISLSYPTPVQNADKKIAFINKATHKNVRHCKFEHYTRNFRCQLIMYGVFFIIFLCCSVNGLPARDELVFDDTAIVESTVRETRAAPEHIEELLEPGKKLDFTTVCD